LLYSLRQSTQQQQQRLPLLGILDAFFPRASEREGEGALLHSFLLASFQKSVCMRAKININISYIDVWLHFPLLSQNECATLNLVAYIETRKKQRARRKQRRNRGWLFSFERLRLCFNLAL